MAVAAEVVTNVTNFRFRHQILNFLMKMSKYLAQNNIIFVAYFKGTPLIKILYLFFLGNVLVQKGLEAGAAAAVAADSAEGGTRNCPEPQRAR